MRCPKCFSETTAEAYNCPNCNLPTPKGRLAAPKTGSGKKVTAAEKRKAKKGKIDFGILLPSTKVMPWILLSVILGASGFFVYWYIYSDPSPITPQHALNAMQQLRRLPSKENGKSIDDYLNAEMKKSKEAGRLVSHQGWTIKPYDKNNYLISFSFDEKEAKKSAEWVVDPQNNTFTPVTELATAVQKSEQEK